MVFLITVPVFYAKSRFFQNATLLGTGLVYPGLVKHMGRSHISQKNARSINEFYKNCFNVYVNYHRPSGFPTITTDSKGKQKKKYQTYLIPYEKLKSLKKAEQYLQKDLSFAILDKIAYAESDNEYAERMQKKKVGLFKNFKK